MSHAFLESRTFREIPPQCLVEVYKNPRFTRELQAMRFNPRSAAVFLDPTGDVTLPIQDFHHRSVDVRSKLNPALPAIQRFGIDGAEVFPRLNVKGPGFIKPETHVDKKHGIELGSLVESEEVRFFDRSTETPWGYDVLGLFDRRMFDDAVQVGEYFSGLGMRIEEFIAGYRLTSIWRRGVRISVNAWKKEQRSLLLQRASMEGDLEERKRLHGLAEDFTKEYEPVIAMRCVRSAFRVRDLADAKDAREARYMLQEAFDAFTQERKVAGFEASIEYIDSPEHVERYLHTIAWHFGKNLGILHGNGYVHKFLHMGNLTLAGEVVDLDSVDCVYRRDADDPEDLMMRLDPREQVPLHFKKDMRDLLFSFRKLLAVVKKVQYTAVKNEVVADILQEGYRAGMSDGEQLSIYGGSPSLLKSVFNRMAYEAIIRQSSLPRVVPLQ